MQAMAIIMVSVVFSAREVGSLRITECTETSTNAWLSLT